MNPIRRGVVFYLQLTAAVVSLLLGIFNLSKESAPIVQKYQETQKQNLLRKQQDDVVRRANEIAHMQIQWEYRGNDNAWRYYSDHSGRYWCRVNIQGVYEYSENPSHQMIASSQANIVR